MNDKYVDLLTDFGFKKLFGTEVSKDLLIDFLNQILPQEHQIETLSYSKNEQLGATASERRSVFDLHCVSKTNGDRFVVEVQRKPQTYYKDRTIYYSTFPIQAQAVKGIWNYQIFPVYIISILNFNMDSYVSPNYMRVVELVERQNANSVFYDKLKYIYIELPKFTKPLEALSSHFEKWLYALRFMANLSERPAVYADKVFERLFDLAAVARLAPKELEIYRDALKWRRDEHNIMETAKKMGKAEGIEKGIEKGKIESVLGFYQKGVSTTIISEALNISEKRVQKIIQTASTKSNVFDK